MEITELQKDLAATFRWTARLNMHEAVANHFSACVPESSNFYVNKAGIHFSRMRASDLILVTKENKEELKNSPHIVDPTAINIHGAIHEKVPHARCIFHAHPKYATALGNKQHMLLANHGILTTGETVADGFNYLYYFEKAAETYLTALSTNQELNVVSHEVAEKTAEEAANFPTDFAKMFLTQIRLILDKEEPDYKD